MNKTKAQDLPGAFVADHEKRCHITAAEQSFITAFVCWLYEHGWEIRRARRCLTEPGDRR